MLYKNIVLVITSFLTLIMAVLISTSYYKYNAKDYSNIKEYVGSDTIDISKDVKIENIDYLYFTKDEGQRSYYIRSLLNDYGNSYGRNAKLIITYNGKLLNFDYDISVVGIGVAQGIGSGDNTLKLRITSKDKNVKGTLDFELYSGEMLRSFYIGKSLPTVISIALAADLIICIIFAFVDCKRVEGFFLYMPDFFRVKQKPLSPEEQERLERLEREKKRQEDEQRKLENDKRKIERIKSYEEKYDLTKPENMVFKELAYFTLGKLFPDENDYKKPEIPSELKNIDEK